MWQRIIFVAVFAPGWTITSAGLRRSRQPRARLLEVAQWLH